MIKIAIVGFGRMGLSHLSILRGVIGSKSHTVTIFDTSITSRILAKILIPKARVIRSYNLKKLRNFDYILFTTPPFNRSNESEISKHLSANIFIEKPIISELPINAMSGYVLQHSPLVKALNGHLSSKTVTKIRGRVKTPLDFTTATGWRSTQFGNITSEFCGHVITMALAPICDEVNAINIDSLVVLNKNANSVSVEFNINENVSFHVDLLANCEDVRKTSYNVEYKCDDNCTIAHNLYEISIDGIVKEDVASSGISTPFYLRGFEFSNQMERFLSSKGDILKNKTINDIERLIGKIQG